jgi:glucose/arabinose dehydrogenase
MARLIFSAVAVVGLTLAASAQMAPGGVQRSALHDYRLVPVVEGLIQPWSIAFLPGGDMLVTERPGRLRLVRNGKLLPTPVPGVPEVSYATQGGLLEVMPHPDFATNRWLYLTYAGTKADGSGPTSVLVRARFEKDALTNVTRLFESVSTGRGHFGGKIAFDGKGHLFLTLGDRQVPPEGDLEKHPAQDLTNHHGKLVRLNEDGTVPSDNPFVGKPPAKPEIWSYGHRNIQGIAIDPATGNVWTTEHGPQGGDELNLDRPGKNYGWPVIGFGVNYVTGKAIHSGTMREGMEQPLHIWVPSIGISGAFFYTGDRFPQWKGQLFVGGMAGEQLGRVVIAGDKVVSRETLLPGVGRIRDIRQGPDGLIYLVTESNAREPLPTAVYRMEPVDRGATR